MAVGLTCPSCWTYISLDEGLQSATCPECRRWLHAIECTSCRRTFVALGDRSQRCPTCSSTVAFASARLKTMADARDPVSGTVSVVWPRLPGSMTARRAPPRSGWSAHAVPHFLVELFLVLSGVAIAVGIVATVVVDLHLKGLHDSSGAILWASTWILASTAISAATFAFFSYALRLLLEILGRVGQGTASLAHHEVGEAAD